MLKLTRFRNRLYSVLYDDLGAASVLMVSSLPMFVLLAGLAIDGSAAFSEQSVLQAAGNSAALAAGLDLRTKTNAQIVSDAKAYADKNLPPASNLNHSVLASSDVEVGKWDFSCAARNGTCFTQCQTMTDPITCSSPNGLTINAVRVLVRRSTENSNAYPTVFLGLAKRVAWKISALAIAAIGPSGGDCFISTTSVTMKNNGTISTNGCNSEFLGSLTGMSATNNSVTASPPGVVEFGSNATSPSGVTISPTAVNNAPIPNDPYANAPIPSPAPCTAANTNQTFTSGTVPSGTYCGTLTLGSVQLNGTYILAGAQVAFSGQTPSITQAAGSTGVTLVMTCSSCSSATPQWATINDQTTNGVSLTFNAPTTGNLSGIAIWGNPAGGTSVSIASKNSFSMTVVGAIYFPQGSMSFKNSSVSSPSCLQFWVGTMDVKNHLNISTPDNCSAAGTFAIGHAKLVL